MADQELPYELTVREVEDRRKAGEDICLIDVREDMEWQICRIEGANLVPMGTVPSRLQELDKQADSTPLVVYCHHGVRSAHAIGLLRQFGFGRLVNLTGGIDRWSLEVDPGVPRY